MTEAVIHRLRKLQSLGIVSYAHCIRAERCVERHPEIFSDATSMTVSEAAALAVESAALPDASSARNKSAGHVFRTEASELRLAAAKEL